MTESVTSEPVDPELGRGGRARSSLDIGAAFVGGALGTVARYGFDLGWPEGDHAVPHTTNVINTTGAFAIGFVATVLARQYPHRHAVRAFLVTGVLGGWTTMSSLAVADARLASVSGIFTATISIAVSFVLGVIAARAGVRSADRERVIDSGKRGMNGPALAASVVLSGGCGAALRLVVDTMVTRRWGGIPALGTLAVNIAGSFLVGIVVGAVLVHGVAPVVRTIFVGGFCAGLTTWSTAMYETVRLLDSDQRTLAIGFGLGGFLVSIAAAALGLVIAGA